VLADTPAFRKTLPMAMANTETVLLAWQMNGQDLPSWNGYPLRLVVPGWTATYWMKHLTTIELRTTPLDNFWMRKAYRVPRGVFPSDVGFTTQDDEKTSPITQILVNSLITSPPEGATVARGGFVLSGIAWDGGHGVRMVEVSANEGATWGQAALEDDLGRFAFRTFSYRFENLAPGMMRLLVRATGNNGAVQPPAPIPNPAGYHHNAMQSRTVNVSA